MSKEDSAFYSDGTPRTGSFRLAAFIVLSVALTLPVDQLFSIELAGGITLSFQTVAMLCSAGLVAFRVLRRPTVRLDLIALLTPLLLLFWFQAIRSVDIERAATYLALLVLCGVLYVEVAAADLSAILGWLNRVIYWTGSIVTLACLARYAYVIRHHAGDILANRHLWDVGSGDVYEVQLGGVIAYQGLAGDPNIVGVATGLILFCGLNLRLRRFDWARHVVNLVLMVAILASNSRGALAGLAVSLFAGVWVRAPDYKKYLTAFVGAGVMLWLVVARNTDWVSGLSNPLEKLQRGSRRRFREWGDTLESFQEHPLAGNGLRFSEALLGKYTENSYLTILADTGLLGLIAYAALAFGPVAFVATGRHSDVKDALPWFVYSVFLFVSLMYVSMEVKPIVWVTCGLLAGTALSRRAAAPLVHRRPSVVGSE